MLQLVVRKVRQWTTDCLPHCFYPVVLSGGLTGIWILLGFSLITPQYHYDAHDTVS